MSSNDNMRVSLLPQHHQNQSQSQTDSSAASPSPTPSQFQFQSQSRPQSHHAANQYHDDNCITSIPLPEPLLAAASSAATPVEAPTAASAPAPGSAPAPAPALAARPVVSILSSSSPSPSPSPFACPHSPANFCSDSISPAALQYEIYEAHSNHHNHYDSSLIHPASLSLPCSASASAVSASSSPPPAFSSSIESISPIPSLSSSPFYPPFPSSSRYIDPLYRSRLRRSRRPRSRFPSPAVSSSHPPPFDFPFPTWEGFGSWFVRPLIAGMAFGIGSYLSKWCFIWLYQQFANNDFQLIQQMANQVQEGTWGTAYTVVRDGQTISNLNSTSSTSSSIPCESPASQLLASATPSGLEVGTEMEVAREAGAAVGEGAGVGVGAGAGKSQES